VAGNVTVSALNERSVVMGTESSLMSWSSRYNANQLSAHNSALTLIDCDLFDCVELLEVLELLLGATRAVACATTAVTTLARFL
jgi:hypothetical protein